MPSVQPRRLALKRAHQFALLAAASWCSSFSSSGLAATPTGAAAAVSEPAWAAYVREPAGFQWKLNSKTVRPNGTTYCEVSLTSQVWQGATWTHPLQVLLPLKSAAPDTAVIFVNGVPGGSETLPQWVADTGVVCAVVGGIYQPCFGGGGGEQIATYSFQQYAATGDPNWVVMAPVVNWNCTEADGRIRVQVTTTAPAQNARLWTCATAGEFKFAKWSAQPLAASARDLARQPSFSGDVAKPAAGRLAAYAEVEFADADGTTFPLTTGVWFSRP